MFRVTVVSIMCGLAAVAAGCRMCASTYDYCKPTFTGQCGEDCSPTARAGSILSGAGPVVSENLAPTASEELWSGQIPYEEEIASGVIISVTDRKLEEAELENAEVETPQLADRRQAVQSKGWTAAKSAERRAP